MDHSFYPEAFTKRNMTIITPEEDDKTEFDRIIFQELAREMIRPQSKEWLLELIRRHEVDGVILGCTELSLILQSNDLNLAVLDSIELHCQAVIDAIYPVV